MSLDALYYIDFLIWLRLLVGELQGYKRPDHERQLEIDLLMSWYFLCRVKVGGLSVK